MTPEEYENVIDELQTVIDETQTTLKRFENTGMDGEMPEDYETLLAILDDAVKQQRGHTQAMLDGPSMPYVDIADFERLAREAISYYVGDEPRILGNLKVVLVDYRHGEEGAEWLLLHVSCYTGSAPALSNRLLMM